MYKIYTQKTGMPCWHAHKLLRVMRLTTILIMMTFMQVSAASYAQRITLKEKKMPLEKVFNAIHQQTGYDFLYERKLINTKEPLDIYVKSKTVEEVLDQYLSVLLLDYTVVGKTIVIKEKTKSFLDRVTDAFKSSDVSGKVLDEKGLPLPGATIKVKKTARITKTDAAGRFSINNLDENAILLVSFMGYKTKEVRLNNQGILTVTLEEDMASLSDVVVVGYGTTKRKDLVGSVSSIGGDDLRKQEATNFTQALAGRAAGVQVSRPGGEPGAGASIRIRGMSTVMGASDPLYVIDGIPVQLYNGGGIDALRSAPANGLMDPLAGIDANDIENIEILKDATATAIYGSRGANGVIVVTTRRGKAGSDPVFNFSYDISIDKQNKFYDVLSGPDYVRFMQDTYAKNNKPIDDVSFPGKGNTDWQRAITQTGLVQNMNLSLLGATQDGTTTYAFSSGLTDQKGILINSGFKRYSIRANIKSQVFNRLKIGTNLNFSSSTQTGGISPIYTTYGVASYRPDIPIYNADGTFANDGSSDNPVASRQSKNSNESRRLLASVLPNGNHKRFKIEVDIII